MWEKQNNVKFEKRKYEKNDYIRKDVEE